MGVSKIANRLKVRRNEGKKEEENSGKEKNKRIWS